MEILTHFLYFNDEMRFERLDPSSNQIFPYLVIQVFGLVFADNSIFDKKSALLQHEKSINLSHFLLINI